MRIALVSPYSWTYPGGVTRHIEALATQLEALGHEVRILAPADRDDRLTRLAHGGARPQSRAPDPRLISLGGTVGFRANGAVSNLAITPSSVSALRDHLRHGGYDVIHVHEPIAPIVSWDALSQHTDAALVGTFHSYSTHRLSNWLGNVAGAKRRMNHLHARIAVSEAAAWTARRFYGGRYRVIPNGVDLAPYLDELDSGGRPAPSPHTEDDGLRILFVGQAVDRKGLPILLRAFEALREHVPATLTIIGADLDEVAPLLLDETGVTPLGRLSDAHKREHLRAADILCAPSLGGESFGMVLTEAFAAGTPVVASDIPGYAGVVRDGHDGLLVPPGDATALAEALRGLALAPERCRDMGRAAAQSAERYAWPRVAAEVLEVYQAAQQAPAPATSLSRAAISAGLLPADGGPPVRARRLPSLERGPATARAPWVTLARRLALLVTAASAGLLAFIALQRIGLTRIAASLLASSPGLVLAGLGLMCLAMTLRGFAWHAILRAALPRVRVRRRDAMRGTFIGVLMSSTLPARLGEPSRALILARRLGRPRETLPVVLGTLVSQTLLNLVALAGLGIAMFSTVNLLDGRHNGLLIAALAPVGVALGVLLAPTLVPRFSNRSQGPSRLQMLLTRLRGALSRVRAGLSVFRQPRRAAAAAAAQLSAWAMQWLSCYVLLVAFGLDHKAGLGAAAAVLFAVNLTAVLPATPANLGIFQAACVVVLHGAYHVSTADAIGYGIVLQAVEVATAVLMGMPALLREGLSWRDMRVRTMHVAPVKLPALPQSSRSAGGHAKAGA